MQNMTITGLIEFIFKDINTLSIGYDIQLFIISFCKVFFLLI